MTFSLSVINVSKQTEKYMEALHAAINRLNRKYAESPVPSERDLDIQKDVSIYKHCPYDQSPK